MSEQNTKAAEQLLSPGLIITVLRSVLKNWLLVVAAVLIAVMAAFVYTDVSYTPEYRATTTFVATSGGTSTTTYSHLNGHPTRHRCSPKSSTARCCSRRSGK